MTKDRRQYRPPHRREAKGRAAARPRRRLVAFALLLGAAVIGLAIGGTFRGVPGARPDQRPSAAEGPPGRAPPPPGEKPSAVPPAPVPPAPVPSALAPVPDTYDALKQEGLAAGARLLERYPDALDAVDLLGRVYTEAGDLVAAARCWKPFLERHPEYAEGYYRLGQYARREGNDEEAVRCFRKAFTLEPTLPDLQALLGRCLMNLDRVEEALAVLEPDVGPSRGGAVRYAQLGQAYLRTQQHEKAKQAFQTAVEITPSYTGAYYGLSKACTNLGQEEEAKKHLESFHKLKAQDTEAAREKVKQDDVARVRRLLSVWYTDAGKLYLAKDDPALAEAHWLRAAAVCPDNTEPLRALADLYQRQGKARRAAEVIAELRNVIARQGK